MLKKLCILIIIGLTSQLHQSTHCAAAKSHATKHDWDTLIAAINTGDLSTIKKIVPSKIHPLEKSRGGHSPMAMAEFHRKPGIVTYFAWTLLIPAIERGDLASVSKIVPSKIPADAKTKGGKSLLSIAQFHNKPEIIGYLQKLNPSSCGSASSYSYGSATNVITFYDSHAPYYEFTNFYNAAITVDGKVWPTTEHYFQAQKFAHRPDIQEEIRTAPTAKQVYILSNARNGKYNQEYDQNAWNKRSLDVMRTALRAKFTQHPNLKKLLLDTGNKSLIEASPTDPFWGWGHDQKGQNWLGKLLVELRSELTAQPNVPKQTDVKAIRESHELQKFNEALVGYVYGEPQKKESYGNIVWNSYATLKGQEKATADAALQSAGVQLQEFKKYE